MSCSFYQQCLNFCRGNIRDSEWRQLLRLMEYHPLSIVSNLQVTRIDGTVDSPPCLKVTHKTFGTQNSNGDTVFCRLSMPVEFHSVFKSAPAVDVNGVHDEDTLKVKHRCPCCSSRPGGRAPWLQAVPTSCPW